MLLRTIYDEKLAQASYLLGCQATGEALVIDPNRDAEQYIKAARKEGLRITHVTETHIHADFVSGTRELAQRTGARMVLSAEGGADWSYGFANEKTNLVHDGDEFRIGNIRVQVMHTPGHTPEHIAFLITDTPVTDQPIGLFSGDFVFVGDVGRPDLLEKAAGAAGTMRKGAQQLYHSMQRFVKLPDYLQVWPGHGAGSACGKALGAVPQTTVGYEKMFSPAFRFGEPEFVDYILSGQPEPPRYFARMKQVNRDGPALIGAIASPPSIDAAALQAHLAAGGTVVDTRNALVFARGHMRGSINIPYNRSFSTWAGSLISYDAPLALIADDVAIADITRDLAMIGFDNLAGYGTKETAQALLIETLPSVSVQEIDARGDALLLDVRNTSEWQEGHIPGAQHIPLAQLPEHVAELNGRTVLVQCQSGGRSAIGASVLQAHGIDAVNVLGGYEAWLAERKPMERSASSM